MNDMKHLHGITNRDQLPNSTGPSVHQSLDDLRRTNERLKKLNDASELVEKILNRYPDYNKGKLEYIGALNEFIASCDYRTQCRLADIMTGISARCKYLPTVADIAELAREFENKFVSIPTTHRYFAPEVDPPPLSQSARARMQKLVDSLHREQDEHKGFAYRPADEVKSSADLKTPDGPISPELRRKLIDEHYEHLAPMDTP